MKRTLALVPFATLALLSTPAYAQHEAEEDLGSTSSAETTAAEAKENEVRHEAEAKEGDYEPTQPFEKAARERKPIKYGHAGQVTVRVGVTFPFKVNFRMDDSPGCLNGVTPEPKVCAFSSPPALEFAVGYAVSDAIEPYAWARLGLAAEGPTRTAASRLFGAGLRIYPMSESRFKLLIEPAAAVEVEGSTLKNTTRNYGTDILAHLNLGGQFEITRNVAVYVSLGPEAAFLRAISLTLNGTLGLQARF